MTPASETIAAYRQRTDQLDDYLGRVVITSQRESAALHDDLRRVLTDHGLDEFVPSKPADVDVFRRVTTNAGKKRVELDDGSIANILVRPLIDDDHQLVRQVVIETIDATGKRLAYQPVADVAFDKVTARVVRTTLPEVTEPLPQPVETVIADIVGGYHLMRGKVNSDALRAIAKRVITKAHGVQLRNTGSVYFSPKTHCGPLEQLAKAAKHIDGMQFDLIALVDEGGTQREMVHHAADADVEAEATRLLHELRELRAKGPVSERRAASLLRSFRELKERAAAHEELLEQQLDESRIVFAQLEHSLMAAASSAEIAA